MLCHGKVGDDFNKVPSVASEEQATNYFIKCITNRFMGTGTCLYSTESLLFFLQPLDDLTSP